MEAVTIIGAIAAIAIVVVISFVVDRYSWGTYDYRPFNPKTIWVSFVCGLLIAVGVYLWLGAGFTDNTLAVLGCGILVYVGLLVYVAWRSNKWIAIWTVTILSALFPVVVPLSTVWFILKPNDKIDELERPSASRVRPSDTIDEDDDDDELERPRGLIDIDELERLMDRVDELERQHGPIDIGELECLCDRVDELERQMLGVFAESETNLRRIYLDELERLRDRIRDLEDRCP